MGNTSKRQSTSQIKSQIKTSMNPNQITNQTLNHPKFSKNGKVQGINSSNTYISLSQSIPNKALYLNYQKKLKEYCQDNQNLPLMLPTDVSFKEEGFCGSSGVMNVKYEYFPYMLGQQLDNRKQLCRHFQQNQLWYIVYVFMMSGANLHSKSQILGDVRPLNVFINENGEMLLGNMLTFSDQQQNYQKTRTYRQVTYLSPQTLQALQEGRDPKNRERCQCFSIGLTLLDAILLSNCQSLYSGVYSFSVQELNKKVQSANLTVKNKMIVEIIQGLVEIDPQKRFTCEDIYDMLRPFQQQILNLQNFEVKMIPKKIQNRFSAFKRQGSDNNLNRVISSSSRSKSDLHEVKSPREEQQPKLYCQQIHVPNQPQFIINHQLPNLMQGSTQYVYPPPYGMPPHGMPPHGMPPLPQRIVTSTYQPQNQPNPSYQALPTQSSQQVRLEQPPQQIRVELPSQNIIYPQSQPFVIASNPSHSQYISQNHLKDRQQTQKPPSNSNTLSRPSNLQSESKSQLNQPSRPISNQKSNSQNYTKFISQRQVDNTTTNNHPNLYTSGNNIHSSGNNIYTSGNNIYTSGNNIPNFSFRQQSPNKLISQNNIQYSFNKKTSEYESAKSGSKQKYPPQQSIKELNSNLNPPKSLSSMGRITTSIQPQNLYQENNTNNIKPANSGYHFEGYTYYNNTNPNNNYSNYNNYSNTNNSYKKIEQYNLPNSNYNNKFQDNYATSTYSNYVENLGNTMNNNAVDDQYNIYEQTLRNIDKQLRESRMMFPENQNKYS